MQRHTALPLALVAATMWLIGCADDQSLGPATPEQPSFVAGEPDQQDLIPNQYIVVFNDNVRTPVQLANGLAAAHGLTLRHTYRHTVKGFSAVFPPAAVAAIQRNPNVRYVEQNAYSYINTHPRLNAPLLSSFPAVAVADAAAAGAAPFRPPSNLVATAVSETQITVTWTDRNTNEEGHELERSLNASGPFAKIVDLSFDQESYEDMGLNSGIQYCYRVRAFRTDKRERTRYTRYSNTDCDTTPGPPTTPAAPTGLSATAMSSSQIDLAWMDNSNNEDGFEIWRCDDSAANCDENDLGGGLGAYGQIDQTGLFGGSGSYSDMGLDPNSTHTYMVRAFNNSAGASIFSLEDDATTPAASTTPAAPTGLSATAMSSSQIDLSWTDNSNNEDGFEIWRCQDSAAACDETGNPPAGYTNIHQTGPNARSYSDMGLTASTTYSYMVRAFNSAAAGTSIFSFEDQATTSGPAAGCADKGIHDDLTDPGLWGIAKVKADQNTHWRGVAGNESNPSCGMQAEFYGIDTGVNFGHPDLNVVEIQCFLAGDPSCTGEDDHGHGSHTAGTAAAIDGGPVGGVVGVAPGAKIHGFKVCDALGQCPNDGIIAAIDTLTGRKDNNPNTAMVANMSLGSSIFEGPSPAMDQAVRRSVNAGVVYALAAGNGIFGACLFPLDAQLTSPAGVGDDAINASNGSNGDTKRANGAITTTSSNPSDTDVDCNYGNPVTVAAPGEGIRSTWMNGGYMTISGTSMATPHSAGAAILVLQGNQTLTPAEVEQQIVDDLDNWTTNDLPNADGRLDARCLGTSDNSCAGNN